jgi:hypothetical protein
VEEQGEVRPDEASQAKLKTRLTCGGVNPQEGCDRRRSIWRRARFEGEHPLFYWAQDTILELPRVGYAPSEFQRKPWSEEALIEGWFPLYAREHECFDLVDDADTSSSIKEERLSPALVSGFVGHAGRENDRIGHEGFGGSPNADKSVCSCQPNAGKPRRTWRLEADASVKEGGVRSGENCLVTAFHRK